MWILHYWEGWWHEVGMMFPLGRLLETHHHWQVSMAGYRSTNQFHYLNRGGLFWGPVHHSTLQGLKTARSVLTIINSDHQPLGQGTPRIGSPSSAVHEWAVVTDNCQLVQVDAGSHQVLRGKGSLPGPHLLLLDRIPTVAGGDSWCLPIIIITRWWFGGC